MSKYEQGKALYNSNSVVAQICSFEQFNKSNMGKNIVYSQNINEWGYCKKPLKVATNVVLLSVKV